MRSLLILLLLCSPAVAQSKYTPAGLAASYAQGWRPQVPPPEYRKPYTGELTINRVPLDDIPVKCKQLPNVLGCAYWDRTAQAWCRIYIPDNVTPSLQKDILAHELGHCNGWPGDHPTSKPKEVVAEIAKGKEVAEKLIQIGIQRLKDNSIWCKVPPFLEGCP